MTSQQSQRGRQAAGALAAGIATWLFLGHWWAVVAALPVAVLTHALLGSVRRAGSQAVRDRAATDLPYAADLLGAVLATGLPVERAVATVADAVPGPVGARFARVARSLELGIDPAISWTALGDLPGGQRLAVAATRSADSGAALSSTCQRLATELRANRAVATETAAHRAGVLLVLPLGLCFLPAFVLAGIVPVIVAVLGGVLR